MISAIMVITSMGLGLGYALALSSRYLKVEKNPITEDIEALLPGSQCGQCGFPGCGAAAEALSRGEAPVTLCPPGGKVLVVALAQKLSVELDLSSIEEQAPMLAVIKSETCIGCTRCLKVCPTDAIIGAPKQLHTVIKSACSACGKCIGVCPTECLHLQPVAQNLKTWRWSKPGQIAAQI